MKRIASTHLSNPKIQVCEGSVFAWDEYIVLVYKNSIGISSRIFPPEDCTITHVSVSSQSITILTNCGLFIVHNLLKSNEILLKVQDIIPMQTVVRESAVSGDKVSSLLHFDSVYTFYEFHVLVGHNQCVFIDKANVESTCNISKIAKVIFCKPSNESAYGSSKGYIHSSAIAGDRKLYDALFGAFDGSESVLAIDRHGKIFVVGLNGLYVEKTLLKISQYSIDHMESAHFISIERSNDTLIMVSSTGELFLLNSDAVCFHFFTAGKVKSSYPFKNQVYLIQDEFIICCSFTVFNGIIAMTQKRHTQFRSGWVMIGGIRNNSLVLMHRSCSIFEINIENFGDLLEIKSGARISEENDYLVQSLYMIESQTNSRIQEISDTKERLKAIDLCFRPLRKLQTALTLYNGNDDVLKCEISLYILTCEEIHLCSNMKGVLVVIELGVDEFKTSGNEWCVIVSFSDSETAIYSITSILHDSRWLNLASNTRRQHIPLPLNICSPFKVEVFLAHKLATIQLHSDIFNLDLSENIVMAD